MIKEKRFADINGNLWEAAYPFCEGCDELIFGGTCGFEGNGCKYPESRIKKPINFQHAFHKLFQLYSEKTGKNQHDILNDIGNCIDCFEKNEKEN